MTSQRARDRLVAGLRQMGVADERVLHAMGAVARHEFIDEAFSYKAYADTALPIGHAQTISQPFVVAHMTALLLGEGQPPATVLEVGTGSGYQAAVLAELVDSVYTVERIRSLYQRARLTLRRLGYGNIRPRLGDGRLGLADFGPFDGIIVTAGAQAVPERLLDQLADGGRLGAPIGDPSGQRLVVIERRGGQLQRRELDAVSFVPLLAGVE
ncbi:MAG: protein-L-isoaspartate(D-aspartate) O-methyltransferase [Salinisphaera sp.]|nr:protein-L-isoaspartate(D-aspartate) O-methyltransferase [Salinisphaera sp.]